MEDNKKNSHANEDSVEFHSGDLVILTDDDGNEVRYEYLDQIEYSDKVYDILVPEDSENEDRGSRVRPLQNQERGQI